MRRRRKPNQYRCIKGAAFALLFSIFAIAMDVIEDGACHMLSKHAGANCSVFPGTAYALILGIVSLCLLHTFYRAYRDFVTGEYYTDLAEAGYL
jgi:hypothetical protein